VVLAGLPNAGKSTLFNALAGSERALVSPIRGTTRDYLSARVNWDGHEIELIDTAGWGEGDGDVMRSAHALREEVLKQADVILWCAAGDASDAERVECMRRQRGLEPRAAVLRVGTKCELGAAAGEIDVSVSARTGGGMTVLRRRVMESLPTAARRGEFIGSSAARCRDSLRQALASIESAHNLAVQGAGDELIAAELRTVLEHTGQVAGRVYTDDLLDRIFSRFCIGK
jgi:tRNA modification GTPase